MSASPLQRLNGIWVFQAPSEFCSHSCSSVTSHASDPGWFIHFQCTLWSLFFFLFISALKAPALVYATLKINIKHRFGSMEEQLKRKSINQSRREREWWGGTVSVKNELEMCGSLNTLH